jgi:mannose-6-phosphate isomerase-like protein (cupin superfamily)
MAAISKENSEHYAWGKACDGWYLLKTPALSVIQERVPPGGSETRHYHQQAQQFFFVLSGEAVMELENEEVVLGPQQGFAVPPGSPHRLLNRGNSDLVFLVISAPPSHGDRVPVE